MASSNHAASRRKPGRPFKDGGRAARALGDALVELARIRPDIVEAAISHALGRMARGNNNNRR